jgi:hypothetical protein
MNEKRKFVPPTAFRPGDPRINRKGRIPGNKNRFHRSFKEVLTEAIELMGGAQAIVTWARKSPENEAVFWTEICTKLLPRIIEGDEERPIPLQVIERRIIDPPDDMIDGEIADADSLH